MNITHAKRVYQLYNRKYYLPVLLYRGKAASYHFIEKILEFEKYALFIRKSYFYKPCVKTGKDEEDFKTIDK